MQTMEWMESKKTTSITFKNKFLLRKDVYDLIKTINTGKSFLIKYISITMEVEIKKMSTNELPQK